MPRGSLRVGGLVVGQTPNATLIVAALALLLTWAAEPGSTLEDLAGAAFFVSFAAWGWDEFAHGVNWFRRILGAGALGLTFVALAISLS